MAMLVKQNPFRQYLFLFIRNNLTITNSKTTEWKNICFEMKTSKNYIQTVTRLNFFFFKVMINDAFMQIFIYIFLIWGLDFFYLEILM